MEFEFDEAKRLATVAKHGLDFLDADTLFDSAHLVGPARMVGNEQRWLAVGMIDDVHVTAIFTRRGTVIRFIFMRRARDSERKQHQAIFGG